MATIAYHASHEQFSPGELLQYARQAEACGFEAVHSSDHFHPWSLKQGQSGYSFAWLGAAMQATRIPFGVIVAPGQRYHPAVVAQATATLAELYPGRLWVALGSGEALNECITGGQWPRKADRNQRLLECAGIIRRLWNGEKVSHSGQVTIQQAKLFTLPPIPPLLLGAALTTDTAEWLGSWADGMITVHNPPGGLKETIGAFRRGGGGGKPVYLKVQLSYARYHQAAIDGAYDQWRTNVLDYPLINDLTQPEHFDAAAEKITHADLAAQVRISADVEQHIQWLADDIALGVDKIILHNVNRGQETFISDFGNYVLPRLKQL